MLIYALVEMAAEKRLAMPEQNQEQIIFVGYVFAKPYPRAVIYYETISKQEANNLRISESLAQDNILVCMYIYENEEYRGFKLVAYNLHKDIRSDPSKTISEIVSERPEIRTDMVLISNPDQTAIEETIKFLRKQPLTKKQPYKAQFEEKDFL